MAAECFRVGNHWTTARTMLGQHPSTAWPTLCRLGCQCVFHEQRRGSRLKRYRSTTRLFAAAASIHIGKPAGLLGLYARLQLCPFAGRIASKERVPYQRNRRQDAQQEGNDADREAVAAGQAGVGGRQGEELLHHTRVVWRAGLPCRQEGRHRQLLAEHDVACARRACAGRRKWIAAATGLVHVSRAWRTAALTHNSHRHRMMLVIERWQSAISPPGVPSAGHKDMLLAFVRSTVKAVFGPDGNLGTGQDAVHTSGQQALCCSTCA